MDTEQSPDTPRENELVQTAAPAAPQPKRKLNPEERKAKRAASYKVYYERRQAEILSKKKETYNQVQKREYYLANKDHLNNRMKDRYYSKKETHLRDKLIKLKDRFPCEEMKKYIDGLLAEGTFKQFTPRMLDFWVPDGEM